MLGLYRQRTHFIQLDQTHLARNGKLTLISPDAINDGTYNEKTALRERV